MSNEKIELATAVKQQVQRLQALIDEAKRAGLDIELTMPHPMDLNRDRVIKLEVSEKIIY